MLNEKDEEERKTNVKKYLDKKKDAKLKENDERLRDKKGWTIWRALMNEGRGGE